jgi:FkbM family methyltransferase
VGIKQVINGVLGVTGYEIRHTPSVANEMARGKYRWLQERRIATVFDVGANVGQFAEMMRAVFPRATIHAFEPLASCHNILTRKMSSLQPMHIYPVALGRVDGVSTMYHNDFSASSSLLPMTGRHREAFPHTGHTIEEQVTVRPLDAVMSGVAYESPVLMKVDVQGFELDVLAGASTTLQRVDVLIVETSMVELYEKQPLFHEVYDFLRARGFVFAGSFDQIVDPSSGAVLQADAIFLKGINREGGPKP